MLSTLDWFKLSTILLQKDIYLPQVPEQNIVKTCLNCIYIVGNNELESTVCEDAYHYRCSIPPITNYYKTSNSWKCSRCKPIDGRGRATLRGITDRG